MPVTRSRRILTMTNGDGNPAQILVDPSLLLQSSALEWLEQLPGIFVASASFRDMLADGRIGPESPLAPSSEPDAVRSNRERALAVMDGQVSLFSVEGARLSEADASVARSVLSNDDLENAVYADEWAYLQSHSVMFSAARHALDAFRRGGAAVAEYGKRVRDEVLGVVIPQDHFNQYPVRELVVRGAIKWVVVGGTGALGQTLGGMLGGIAGTGITGPVVRAFDP